MTLAFGCIGSATDPMIAELFNDAAAVGSEILLYKVKEGHSFADGDAQH